MPLRRYTRSPVLQAGRKYGTSAAANNIKSAVDSGALAVDIHVLQEGERLDSIAGRVYGDGRLWWVIAAASGIGWGLQVPPGTRLSIPREISSVAELVG